MSRMTKQNLNNIKDRFEAQTGVPLEEKHRVVSVRTVVLAAVLAVGMLMTAFTYPLFSSLDEDALTLDGTYLGDGVVSVWVENDSDKVLEFKDVKLFSWNDGEVEPISGGEVLLENTRFEPHSEGYLTVNLSGAYDIEALETTVPGKPKESWYYLLLTNNGFLFGHDWMCSFHFVEEVAPAETEPPRAENTQAHTIGEIEEDLRFYFEDAYYHELAAFNEKNFEYQQKVHELLMRTEGTLVRPMDPMLLVERPESGVIFDEAVPEEEQYRLVDQGHYSLDGYRRMVGSQFSGVTSDFALQLGGTIPLEQGETDGVSIPLIYLFTYDAEAVKQEGAYAFIYGRIIPFTQLEADKVYGDEQYVVYEVTHLFYTDLDAYIDTFVSGNSVYFDESIRQRLHNIHDFYRNRENLTFYYNLPA